MMCVRGQCVMMEGFPSFFRGLVLSGGVGYGEVCWEGVYYLVSQLVCLFVCFFYVFLFVVLRWWCI